MRTGWECVRIAKALYIIPFMFAFGSLLDPSPLEIAFDFTMAMAMFAVLPAATLGYWRTPLPVGTRILLGLTALGLFMATVGPVRDGLWWLAASAFPVAGAAVSARRRPHPR